MLLAGGKKLDVRESFVKIISVFKKKEWDKHQPFADVVLDRFGDLLLNLNDEESQLICTLLEDYKWWHEGTISSKIFKILDDWRIILNKQGIKKVYLFPILNEKDSQKKEVKSGVAFLYKLKTLLPYHSMEANIKFVYNTDYQYLSNTVLLPNEKIVLVDDYIGSGTTLKSCLKIFCVQNGFALNNIFVITLGIQSRTLIRCQCSKINVLYWDSLTKGISDNKRFLREKTTDVQLDIMSRIEEKLFSNLKPSDKFGFENSEGLLTFDRTPNNTFNIFWRDYNNKGSKIKKSAPFKRSH